MADTRVSGDISAGVMLKHFDCKQFGYLSKEGKGMLGWSKSTVKYFIISRGAIEGCVWNFHCFDNHNASKQEWSISMREVDSILEYNKGIVGIRIIFIDHKTPELILQCDTAKTRETWLKMFKEAHADSQTFSADSGFGSGGSVPNRNSRRFDNQRDSGYMYSSVREMIDEGNSRRFDNQRDSEYMYSRIREIYDEGNWNESERASTTESNDLQDSYAEKVNGRNNREPYCSNEDDQIPLHVKNALGNDDVVRRHAAKSHNEKSQNRNKVIIGDDKVYKRSSKVEDTAVTDACNRSTDMTCLKENLPSPVQETKSGNRRCETQLATTVHSKHKTNPAKTIVQEQSDQLTSPFSSDDYKTFEQGQDENTCPKVIDDNAAFDYTMADSNSSAFMSVAGCSDSFVSVRQNKLDTDSHSIGTSEGDKNSGHVLTKENSFKSSQVGKSPENEGQLQKQMSSPHYHDYYPPGLLSESSKEDLVLPLPAQGINDEGAESSNCICSKHDEEIASETPVLPMGNGDVNSHQASTSYSKQTKLTDTAETENTTQSLESNLDDESNTYEHMTVSENKEQNIFSTEENRIKRDSNIRTKSSDSDSSTDIVTYETPDEGAQHENGIFSREEEYYCEHHKDIKRNLQNNPPGTFLICNIRSEQVLCLVADDDRIKRFIIHRHGEKLSLFKDFSNPENTFPDLNKLLRYYHMYELPSKNFKVRLERAYKSDKED